MTSIKYTRRADIDGFQALIYDGLVSPGEIAVMEQVFKSGQFSKTEFARKETMQYMHWVCEIGVDHIQKLSMYNASREALAAHFPSGNYKCFRAYCNQASYGDQLMTHRDCQSDDDRVVTALWYVCGRWEVDWGGETVFYDKRDDAVFMATPKPGRLALFHGAIKHAGRPPNRICTEPRYTMAIKFLRES